MKQFFILKLIRTKAIVILATEKAKEIVLKKTISATLKRVASQRILGMSFFSSAHLTQRMLLFRNTIIVQLVFVFVEFVKVMYKIKKGHIEWQEGIHIMGKVIFSAIMSYLAVVLFVDLSAEYIPKEPQEYRKYYFMGIGLVGGLAGLKVGEIIFLKIFKPKEHFEEVQQKEPRNKKLKYRLKVKPNTLSDIRTQTDIISQKTIKPEENFFTKKSIQINE
jgi:hypothetical protein